MLCTFCVSSVTEMSQYINPSVEKNVSKDGQESKGKGTGTRRKKGRPAEGLVVLPYVLGESEIKS